MKVIRVANIGARGRRRRVTGGLFWLILGGIAAAIIALAHVGSAWYALLVLPFSLAALGYFQARAHT
jgi:hypothetical protein